MQNSLYLILSIILTSILYFAISDNFSDLVIEISEKPKESVLEDFYYYFEDVDYDGFSEEIILKTEREKTFYALKVQNHNGIIDQWNFKSRWLKNSIFIGDYDNDKVKEIFVFTVNGDSLFLSCVDVDKSPNFEIREQFLISRKNSKKPWDIIISQCELVDVDEDNFKELYFIVFSGFDHAPRKVLRYDINDHNLIQSENFPAALYRIIKLENENQFIFLVSSIAYANFPDSVKYSDYYTWLFMFDKDLKLTNQPVKLSGFKSNAFTFHYSWMQKNEAYLLNNFSSSYNETPSLKKINSNLIIEKDTQLPEEHTWYILPFDHFTDNQILLINNNAEIFVFDKELEFIEQIQAPFLATNGVVLDINHNYTNELVLATNEGIYCLNSDLDILSVNRFEKRLPIINSIGYFNNPITGRGIYIDTDQEILLIEFKNNPFTLLLYPFLLLSVIFFYSILSISHYRFHESKLIKKGTQFILDSDKSIYFILSERGVVKFASRNASTVLNVNPYNVLNKPIDVVLNEEKNLLEYIRTTIDHYENDGEKTLLLPKGNISAKVLLAPVKFYSQRIGFVVRITQLLDHDISKEQKKWLQTIQQIAHNIKTPVSSIQLNLETIQFKLRDGITDIEKTGAEFELIFEELNRIKKMSKDFIRAINVREKETAAIDLNQLVKRIISGFNHKEKIKITLDIEPEANTIYSNPQQIELLLRVIIENSYDAISETGRINISATMAHYLGNRNKQYLAIEIADTGEGVPKEIAEQIFEPFFTTKSEGTGLGLSIARQIVHELDGEIQFNSKSNFSTTIRVMLPIGNKELNDEQYYSS